MTSRSFLKRIQLTSKRKFYTLVYSLYENRMSLCLFFNMFASKKNPKNKKKLRKQKQKIVESTHCVHCTQLSTHYIVRFTFSIFTSFFYYFIYVSVSVPVQNTHNNKRRKRNGKHEISSFLTLIFVGYAFLLTTHHAFSPHYSCACFSLLSL